MDISLSSPFAPEVSGESVPRKETEKLLQETRNKLILTTAILDLKEREIERLQLNLQEKETIEDQLERLGADEFLRKENEELKAKLEEQEAKATEEWNKNVTLRIRACKLMFVVQKIGKGPENGNQNDDGEEMIENHILELEKTIKNQRCQLEAKENEIVELDEKLQLSEEKVAKLEEKMQGLDDYLLGAQHLREQMNMLAKEFGLEQNLESRTSGKRARTNTENQENENISLDASTESTADCCKVSRPSKKLKRGNVRKVKVVSSTSTRLALKLRI